MRRQLLWFLGFLSVLLATAWVYPAPVSSPRADIQASPTGRILKPTFLDARGSIGDKFEWTAIPPDAINGLSTFDGGKLAAFSAAKPGRYVLILSADRQAVAYHILTVGGDPLPDPPEPPEPPEPNPPDPLSGWAKWAKEHAEKLVQSPNRRQEALRLAGSLEAVAASSAAGAYDNPPEDDDPVTYAREEMRRQNRAVLGAAADVWQPFADALAVAWQKLIDEGKLHTLRQYEQVWRDVAKGLREVR